jgi:flavin-dependent dehydrogenase
MSYGNRKRADGGKGAANSSWGPLREGSRIAVVGAGPAGSFFALHALDIARRRGVKINISLIDGKSFRDSGPRGCNMCAGVIGDGLVKKLHNMGVPLTSQVIRHEIEGYSIHAQGSVASLKRGPEMEIYTVFRGGGPPSDQVLRSSISFDQFLLDFAVEQGAEYLPCDVSEIHGPDGEEGRARLMLGDGTVLEEDLIVGAFGVNSPLLKRMPFGYRPPATWHTCQAEIKWTDRDVKESLKGMVHIFPINTGGVDFIAATPKKEHVTLTAIGRHVKWRDLEKAANASEVKDFLPPGWKMNCHCHPQVPVAHARLPYSDRIVIIGDAGYSRYLKNGIESAYYTSLFAAQTAFQLGVSGEHFRMCYDRWCRDMFSMDNTFGRLMFFVHNRMMANRYLAATEQGQLLHEQGSSQNGDERLSRIIWHLFAGDLPYRRIMLSALDAGLQFRMLARLARNLMAGAVKPSLELAGRIF